jgi:hypothetical protein
MIGSGVPASRSCVAYFGNTLTDQLPQPGSLGLVSESGERDGQDLGRLDAEHGGGVFAAVVERAVANLEAPHLAVLGHERLGDLVQRVLVGNPDGDALHDDVEVGGPRV